MIPTTATIPPKVIRLVVTMNAVTHAGRAAAVFAVVEFCANVASEATTARAAELQQSIPNHPLLQLHWPELVSHQPLPPHSRPFICPVGQLCTWEQQSTPCQPKLQLHRPTVVSQSPLPPHSWPFPTGQLFGTGVLQSSPVQSELQLH